MNMEKELFAYKDSLDDFKMRHPRSGNLIEDIDLAQEALKFILDLMKSLKEKSDKIWLRLEDDDKIKAENMLADYSNGFIRYYLLDD